MANSTINQLTAVSSITNADEVEVQKTGETSTKKGTVQQFTAVEAAARSSQDDVIEFAVGLNADGTYPPLVNSWYLRAADHASILDRSGLVEDLPSDIMNALRLLDYQIKTTNDSIGSFMKTITVRAESANVLSMNAVPFLLIPSRVGYATEIISVYGKNGFNSTAFEAGTAKVEIKYNGGATMFEFDNTFIEATATAYQRGLATAGYVALPATAIVAYCATAPSTGNGYLEFTITYRQHAI